MVVERGVVVVVGRGVVVVALRVRLGVHVLVVLLAEQTVVPQRELVTRDELPLAGRTPEALDVVYFGLGAHYKVILTERQPTLITFGAKQSGTKAKQNTP